MKLDILYFSWVRERVGQSQETVETEAITVTDLVDDLTLLGAGYALAFVDTGAICVAVDQELSDFNTPL